MPIKKNNRKKIKKPRIESGLEDFGTIKKAVDKAEATGKKQKKSTKNIPKLVIKEGGYRTVTKNKKVIFTVPDFGVELHIDKKIFNTRAFHRLFPSMYKDFNIFIDHANKEVSFHVPHSMAAEHKVQIQYREGGSFVALKYEIKPQ